MNFGVQILNLILENRWKLKACSVDRVSTPFLNKGVGWVPSLEHMALLTVEQPIINVHVWNTKVNEGVRWRECFQVTSQFIERPTEHKGDILVTNHDPLHLTH